MLQVLFHLLQIRRATRCLVRFLTTTQTVFVWSASTFHQVFWQTNLLCYALLLCTQKQTLSDLSSSHFNSFWPPFPFAEQYYVFHHRISFWISEKILLVWLFKLNLNQHKLTFSNNMNIQYRSKLMYFVTTAHMKM